MNRREFIQVIPFSLEALRRFLNRKFSFATFDYLRPRSVLINPGHNKDSVKYGSARFIEGIGYEHVLNASISEKIRSSLQEQGVEAFQTMNQEDYRAQIIEYKEKNNEQLKVLINNFHKKHPEINNHMPLEEALTQLSIVQWAEANGFELALHIHINDVLENVRKFYSGFSVITSPRNLSSEKSNSLAQAIYNQLITYFSPSNNKNESSLSGIGKSKKYVPGLMKEDFLVLGNELYATSLPSVIVECGFLSEKYKGGLTIVDQDIQALYAARISQGVLDYLRSQKA